MPAERTLPIAAAQREFTVKVDGTAVPRAHQLVAASVSGSAQRIASARLVYADGSASASAFPLADSATFAPGARVEVLAGSGNAPELVFSGIVVRLRARVREHAPPQLVVDCRHAASRLGVARRSAIHVDQTDSDVIARLLGDAGLDAEVASTAARHEQLVQHDATDWDFIVARAHANGLLVLTRGAHIACVRPALSAAPVATLQFGATLLEFDAEADARLQAREVHALSWDEAEQAVHDATAATPAFAHAGNLDPDTLAGAAGAARIDLRHAALAPPEAQALADAQATAARVNLASGRAKCVGLPQLLPGDVVQLAGVGARFNGKVFVTGVRHEFDTVQGFKTHLQFGGVELDDALLQRLARPRSASLLASVAGLQCGVVTDLEDPQSSARVRVRLPLVNASDDGVWARIATLDAGRDRGLQFRPEVGDEVVVGFLDDDPRHPVVLGMLHGSAKTQPLPASNANAQKGYVSRSGMKLLFDDDKKSVTLSTPGGRSLVIDDDAGAFTLKDGSGNQIVMDAQGITVQSAAALTLKAATEGSLEAATSLSAKAAQLQLEGSASAELKGGTTATLKGGTVLIN